ncbi:rhodanese-like domain-containing protein 4, chloroplastic [Cynara cardunculus var. scolymus]|uniref:rhodanese-like domain-containing protein 4, chloroplastic n=1 Tax=Cynara cardunculus var. scolymus TaxID=59895 RepID=UPI000D62F25B|nr:rhodanese-like domain-containing protein 4, chloroplastic [Cynara cardunculus var. scolymus]
MEALNAVALKPISVLKPEPKKHSSFPTNLHLKISKPHFHGGSLVLISSIFNSAFAKALTYEEALNQSTTSSDSSFSPPDFDVSGVIDGIINFGVENPALLAAGAAVLAVPVIVSQFLGKPKPWGVESAKSAYEKLGDDGNAQLLDIRAVSEIRQVGSPDIRGLKKKPIRVSYNGDDKTGFLKKLGLKFKEPENTTLFILDKFDGSSELVAELVTVNGFKAAYAIKDGAEGSRGWMNSGLPWILPQKSFAFDFSGVTDAIDGLFGDGSDAVSVIFGIAAATGLGLLAFTEVETILEVLGSAALVQLVSKKLLFAEDRKKTLEEVQEFLTIKIGPKDLLDDIKDIGKALLPSPVTSKSIPETTASQEAVVAATSSAPPKIQPEAATPAEPEIPVEPETPAEPETQVNLAATTEIKEEAVPKPRQSLSPYPYYPDLKPPTSPSPSRP